MYIRRNNPHPNDFKLGTLEIYDKHGKKGLDFKAKLMLPTGKIRISVTNRDILDKLNSMNRIGFVRFTTNKQYYTVDPSTSYQRVLNFTAKNIAAQPKTKQRRTQHKQSVHRRQLKPATAQ